MRKVRRRTLIGRLCRLLPSKFVAAVTESALANSMYANLWGGIVQGNTGV